MAKSAAWTRKEGQNPSGGLNAAGRASYRRANPGSKLSAPVTESKPSGKRAERKKSFCARMCGMKSRLTSKKQRETLTLELIRHFVSGCAAAANNYEL